MKEKFEEKVAEVNAQTAVVNKQGRKTFKGFKKLAVLGFAIVMSLSTLTGCVGNNRITDGLTNKSNTFHYIIINENGIDVLYEVDKWMHSESDAMGFIEKGTDQTIWSSFNNGQFYKDMPGAWAYDYTAAELRAMSKEEIDAIKEKANGGTKTAAIGD